MSRDATGLPESSAVADSDVSIVGSFLMAGAAHHRSSVRLALSAILSRSHPARSINELGMRGMSSIAVTD